MTGKVGFERNFSYFVAMNSLCNILQMVRVGIVHVNISATLT